MVVFIVNLPLPRLLSTYMASAFWDTALSPGFWCTRFSLCSDSVSPVPWQFCTKSLWPLKSNSEDSLPFADPQAGKSVMGPWTFLTVFFSLWVVLVVLWWGQCTWYLLQEDLQHMPHDCVCFSQSPAPVAGHCWPVPLQETLKCRVLASVSCGASWSCAQGLFDPSELFWWVWGLF